jgi:hypothetical protein
MAGKEKPQTPKIPQTPRRPPLPPLKQDFGEQIRELGPKIETATTTPALSKSQAEGSQE